MEAITRITRITRIPSPDIWRWFKADARLYRTDQGCFISISRAHTWDAGDETMAFYAHESGEPIDWGEIDVGYSITHEELLQRMGYEIK